ncbi:hypothetical protein BVX98_06745, partial [bacterium F11]
LIPSNLSQPDIELDRNTMVGIIDQIQGIEKGYKGWWDRTDGETTTTYVNPEDVFNQLKINTQTTSSLTRNRDDSKTEQNNVVTYKYGRHRLTPLDPAAEGTPNPNLTRDEVQHAENDGHLLLGAFGKGDFVQDDGNGNVTVGSTEQRFTVTRGQRAQVAETRTETTGSTSDGGLTRQMTEVYNFYDERTGRLRKDVPAVGIGASWSIDGDGNITTSGAFADKEDFERTDLYDVTDEKVVPFQADPEGHLPVNTVANLVGEMGVRQTYKWINGQSRLSSSVTKSRIDGTDGSTQVQEVTITNAYNNLGHLVLDNGTDQTKGLGDWTAYDGIPDNDAGLPLGHITTGKIWQDFTIIQGQARLIQTQQNRGTERKTPNIDRDADGIWTQVHAPLFDHEETETLYAHTENYVENEYDADGILTRSQSASNNFSNDGVLTHNWQKAIYHRVENERLNRWVRDRGDIDGVTLRFDYINFEDGGHELKTDFEIEKTAFTTDEIYELRGENQDQVRRVETKTDSTTYGMDGSYNHQDLVVTYAYDDQAKLVKLGDENNDGIWNYDDRNGNGRWDEGEDAEERTHGYGTFVSHSGRDIDEDEVQTGIGVEQAWLDVLASDDPTEVWDWTKGELDQEYRVFDFGPNSEVGIARLEKTDSISDTISRDLSFTHQRAINTVAYEIDDETGRPTLKVVLESNYGTDENPEIVKTEGNVHAVSHSGRDESLFGTAGEIKDLENTITFNAEKEEEESDWFHFAQSDKENWWDTSVSDTLQEYDIIFNQQKVIHTHTESTTESKDFSFNHQSSDVYYKYGRVRYQDDVPLTDPRRVNPDQEGPLLVGAFGTGSFYSHDGAGSSSSGDIEQVYRIVRGQQIRLDTQTTVSDSVDAGGSPTHSLTTVKNYYDKYGRLDRNREGGPAEGWGASWSLDQEGNLTTSGALYNKDELQIPPWGETNLTSYRVTDEQIAPFDRGEDNINDVIGIIEENGTLSAISGQFGIRQEYVWVAGQAKIRQSTTHNLTHGADGSKNIQRVTVANDYVTEDEGGFVGQLESTTGSGRWTTWNEQYGFDPTILPGYPPNGLVLQEYTKINGQARMTISRQFIGNDDKTPLNLNPDLEVWNIYEGQLLFGEREDTDPIYPHTESYVENTYDDNGALEFSRSASETYTADGFVHRSYQKTEYETETLGNGRVVRKYGFINGRTERFTYTFEDGNEDGIWNQGETGGVDTSVPLEETWFETRETYGIVGEKEIVRRIKTETESETRGLDQSLNHQWLVVDYFYDEITGVMLDGADGAKGTGTFYSSSGFSPDGAAPVERMVTWDDKPYDITVGRIDQEYETIYVRPPGKDEDVSTEMQIGVAKLKKVFTDSKTESRDGTVNIQHSETENTYGIPGSDSLADRLKLYDTTGFVDFSSRDTYGNFTSGHTDQTYRIYFNQAKLQQSDTRSWTDNFARFMVWLEEMNNLGEEFDFPVPFDSKNLVSHPYLAGTLSADLGTVGFYEDPFDGNPDEMWSRQESIVTNDYDQYGRLQDSEGLGKSLSFDGLHFFTGSRTIQHFRQDILKKTQQSRLESVESYSFSADASFGLDKEEDDSGVHGSYERPLASEEDFSWNKQYIVTDYSNSYDDFGRFTEIAPSVTGGVAASYDGVRYLSKNQIDQNFSNAFLLGNGQRRHF